MPSRRDFLANVGQATAALYAFRLPYPSGLRARPDLSDVPIGLDWRMLGPFRGCRVAAGCGGPGRPEAFYFGHEHGGCWKTKDAGRTWRPRLDHPADSPMSALADAPAAS